MPTIKVKGMSCQHCVQAVTRALSGIDGIENVSVDLESGTASYDEKRQVPTDEVRSAIEEAGYELG